LADSSAAFPQRRGFSTESPYAGQELIICFLLIHMMRMSLYGLCMACVCNEGRLA
jgi:hypothetical protein